MLPPRFCSAWSPFYGSHGSQAAPTVGANAVHVRRCADCVSLLKKPGNFQNSCLTTRGAVSIIKKLSETLL